MLLSRDELYAPLVHLKLHSTYNEMPLSKKMLHENTFHGESSDVCWNKHAMGVRRVCVAMAACMYRFAAAGDRGSRGTCQMCVRGCDAPILTCWNES
jgi:hypothetical protein